MSYCSPCDKEFIKKKEVLNIHGNKVKRNYKHDIHFANNNNSNNNKMIIMRKFKPQPNSIITSMKV